MMRHIRQLALLWVMLLSGCGEWDFSGGYYWSDEPQPHGYAPTHEQCIDYCQSQEECYPSNPDNGIAEICTSYDVTRPVEITAPLDGTAPADPSSPTEFTSYTTYETTSVTECYMDESEAYFDSDPDGYYADHDSACESDYDPDCDGTIDVTYSKLDKCEMSCDNRLDIRESLVMPESCRAAIEDYFQCRDDFVCESDQRKLCAPSYDRAVAHCGEEGESEATHVLEWGQK